MCDCFHLAFPNWHGAPAGTGAERRLRAPDLSSEDRSACDEPSQFTEGERPRPQGSSPVEDHPETEKYSDSDKEEDDPHHKRGSRKKGKKPAFGCGFDRRSTPKMSKLKEAYSPESGMIVKTAKDGGAEGLVYGGGGKEGIFIKEVVPESPASKSLQLKEGDQLLSATVYFDNVSYQDAIQILEHAQAYKVKLCLKRKPDITETEPLAESDIIPEDETFTPEMREHGKSKRRGDARISWPKFPSLGRGKKSRFARSHSSSEADEQRKLELSPPTSDTESPIKTQDALKGKKRHKMKLPSLTKRGRISSSEDQDTDEPTACAQEAAELISPEGLQSPMERRPGVHRIEQMALVEGSDARVTKPLAIQHKVELIAIDSALKTTDLTVALAGQDSPTGPLSPDGKKKKKERSELKMKMTAKDKSNKKEANAKSPKRLKTLGASLETAVKGDQPEHTSQTEQTSPLKGKGKTKIRTLLPKREDIEIPGMEDTGRRTKVKGLHDELPETVQLSIDVDSVKEAVSKLPGYKLPKVDMCGVLIPEEITVIDANAQRISVKTPTKVTDGRMKQEAPISKAEDTSTPELSKTSFKLPKIKPSDSTSEEVLTVTQMDQTTTETTQACEPALNSKESDKISKTTKIGLPSIGFSKADFRMPDVGMYFAKPNISGPKDYTGKGERTIFLQEQLGEGGITSDAKMYEAERSAMRSTGELKYIDSEESPVEREVDFTIPEITGPQVNGNLFKNELDVKKPKPESEAQLKEAWVVDLGPVKAQASSHKDKTPEAKVDIPRKDLAVNISAPSVDIEGSVMDMKTDAEQGGKGGKFKMPHLSFSIPKVKGRKTDSGWSKKGSGVTMPEAKVAVQMPDTPKIYTSEAKAEVKLAKTSESPELKIEAKIPELATDTDVKVKGPKSEAQASSLEEYPPQFKFPTLKLPEFGVALPRVDLEMDKDVKVDQLNVKSPGLKVEAKIPELATDIDVKVKGPKSEAQASSLEQYPPQFKFPTLKLPKFGVALPRVDLEMDKDVKVDQVNVKSPGLKVEAKIPELATDIDVKVKGPKSEAQASSLEESPSQFKFPTLKLPKFGLALPQVDLEMDKDVKVDQVNVKSQGLKIEAKIPELATDTDVKVKGPKSEAQASSLEQYPPQFKFPTLKLPKFGVALPRVDLEMDKDVKVDQVNGKSPGLKVEAKIPELATDIDVKVKGLKSEAQASTLEEYPPQFKFPTLKLPKFGVALPQVDLEMDKDVKVHQVNVQSPGLKVEAKIPELATDTDVKVKGPKSEAQASSLEESPSQFKFPTLKLPKFGMALPQVDLEMDKDVKVDEVNVKSPELKVEAKIPELATAIDVKVKGPKSEAQVSSLEESPSQFKFPTLKLPKFGMALPQVDLEMDKDVKVDQVNVKSPGLKVEAKIPELAADIDVKVKGPKSEAQASSLEESPSQFKFPTLKLPKFGMALPQVDLEMDKDVKVDQVNVKSPGLKVEAKIPEFATAIDVKVKGPKSEAQASSLEESPSQFKFPTLKLPKFGMALPQVDLEMDKDVKVDQVNVKSPGLKIEAKIPEFAADIDVKVKGPKSEAQASSLEESPSQFKFPTLKLPKFGMALPQVDLEMDKDVKVDQVNVKSPGLKVEAKIPEFAADIDVKVKGPKSEAQASSLEESPSQFKFPTLKLPKFGMALPQVDLEMDKDVKVDQVNVKSPGLKVEAKIPEFAAAIDVKVKGPKSEAQASNLEESPSQFKFPTLKLPKFGMALPQVDLEMDKDVKVDQVNVKSPGLKVEAKIPEFAADIDVKVKGPKSEAQASSLEESPSQFKFPTLKLPKFGMALPQVDLEMDKDVKVDQVNVKSPGLKIEAKIPEFAAAIDVKVKGPKSEAQASSFKESPSQFKFPTLKLPKFGLALPQVDLEMDKDVKVDQVNVKSPGLKVDAKIPELATDIDVKVKGPKSEAQASSLEESPSKFKFPTLKLPKFGLALPQVDLEMDKDVKVDQVNVKSPELKVDAKIPELATDIDVKVKGPKSEAQASSLEESPSKFKFPTLKLPKFGMALPQVDSEMGKHVKVDGAGLKSPEVKVEAEIPEPEAPKIEARPGSVEGSPSKFKLPTIKLPKLGVALPQVSVGVPDMDTDIKVDGMGLKSPEVKVEAEIPEPATDIDVTVKKSRFAFPKFSLTKQSSKESEVDIGLPDVDVSIPEGKMQITSPKVEFQPPEVDVNVAGQESKFKMPKFGISMPKMKGPDIDFSLSRKEGEIKLPETEVELPDVDVKLPSVQVDIEAPKIEARPGSVEGSPSKFKLPTIKLPKLGVALPQVSVGVPDMDTDIKVDGAGLKSPEVKVEAEIPGPATDIDVTMKKSRFSFPKFSRTKQSSKESEVDIGLPDVDVSIPEGKMQITSPKVEFQPPEVDVNIDGPESKLKMPKFGIAVPKMKGPNIDFSLSRKEGEIKLPDTEVELPDVDVKLPSVQVDIETQPGSVEGSPSKFKLPTIKLPKLGVALPQVSVEVPDMDRDFKVDVAGLKSPEVKVEAEIPEPATDIDVTVKKSRFSFPKFSLTKQSSKESEVDIGLPDVDVSIPEGKMQIISPKVEFQPPEVDVNIDGPESKLKMPKFGISMPKMKGPNVDFSLSKKEGDIKRPEPEVELPDVDVQLPSVQVDIEAPKIEARPGSVEGSPSKFKLPTIKLPKLGVALPQVSVGVPDMDTDIKVDEAGLKSPEVKVEADIPEPATDIDVTVKKSRFSFPIFSRTKQSSKESEVDIGLPDVDVSIPEGKMQITSPKVEFQPPEVDVNVTGQESKFKMPKFGISMPKMKGPDIDFSLSKKEGDIKLPEPEVELPDVDVQLPSVQVDIEARPGSVEGSPSKFKLPTIKLPKLGVALPQVSVGVPDMDTDIKVDGAGLKSPEVKVEAEIPEPATDIDVTVKKSRFSFPKFSLTKQSSKESEVDIGLPDVDVSIPEGKMQITTPKVEFQPTEVDVNIDGQESKFKMPKFGISMPKMKGPDIDFSLLKKEGEIKLPETEIELPDVDVELPSVQVDIEAPKIEARPGSVEGSPSKFKLPTIKLPKLGVALPQVNVEVPDMDRDIKVDGTGLKSPEVKVDAEIPGPATDIDVKVKKSRFSFPKFSLTKQSSKESEVDIGLPDVDGSIPEGKMQITSPKGEFQPTEVDVNIDGQESKFKMPKFGISMPKMKGPDIDFSLSRKEGEIKLPETEVELPDVDVKLPSVQVDIEAPKIEARPGSVEGSPSKFKLPTIKLPKLGVALPQVNVEVPDMDRDIKVDGMGLKSPEVKVEAEIPGPATDIDVTVKKSRFSFPKFSLTKQSSKESEVDIGLPDVDVSIPEGKMQITSPKVEFQPPELDVNVAGQESKFKMPKFGISMPKMKGPDVDFSLSKKEGDIKLPETEVELPEIDVNLPSVQVDIEAPKIEARPGSVEGSPSKFKLPTIKLPKLGVALPQVSVGVPDLDTDIKVDGAGLKSPEVKVEAEIPEPATDIDVTVKKSRFSFPKFSLTKQSSKESEVDFGLPDVDVSIPEGKMQITSPKVEFQPPEVDVNVAGQESKFKMPKFGISMPKMKGPDIDSSLSRKEGEIKLPETEVELPDVDVKLPSVQVDIEAPKIEARPGSVEGSPSKFKLPTIKLPKFGVALPQVSVGVPDMNTDIKVDGAGLKSPEVKVEAEIPEPATDIDVTMKKSRFSFPKFSLTKQSSKESEVDIGLPDVDVSIPEGKMQITSPKVEFQPPEVDVNIEGQESKFKMPKFGISMPKMKGPDIDFSLSRKEGEIKLPETEVELPDVDVKLPSVQVDIEAPKIEARPGSVEGSPSKFKLPTIKLPKLGVALPQVNVEVPDMDRDIKVDGTGLKSPEVKVEAEIPEPATDIDVTVKKSRFAFPKFSLTKQSSKESEVDIGLPDFDVSIPEGKMQITSPKGEFQPPEMDVNIDGPESKFKMPKFGISMPKMKGPDVDFSLSKKEGDIKLPETEVELPDVDVKLPSVQVDIAAPKIEARPGSVEGSPSKFKLPTIKLPKLGVALPQVSVGVPDMDTDIKVDGAGLKSPEVKVEAEIPEPATDIDVTMKKSRFSFPKFSLTKQSSKESEVDIGLPDVDVSIPEGKMQITSPKVEFQPPEVDVNIEGQESKFKMPKFGISMPKMKGPDIDFSLSRKEGEIKLPETEVELPDVDVKLPSVQVDIEAPKIEARPGSVEGSPSKFKLPTIKLPKLGVALPQVNVEVPDMDRDIKVDGTGLKSPEVKVEAEIPEPATDIDVTMKKSRFSFPKFSLTKQSSKESEVDIGLPDVDVSIPEGKMQITSPKVEFQPPEVDVNIEGQESKFKMPKFGISMPKMKGPDIDFSLSRKEGEIKLPETEVELPDVDVKLPSVQVDIEAPKIEARPGSVEGSPSKFKLPTIKLPKLGVALPQVNVEVPDMDRDIKVDGTGLKSPEVKVEAEIPGPATDIDVTMKKSRFSFPKFSLTKQSSKESEIDIGLPDVDVSIPEGKMQITSPKVEFQPPEVDVNIDGPESKFKMPKFGISVPKMKGPDIDFSLSRKEGEIKLPDTEVELPDVDVKLPSVQVDIDAPKIEARPGSVEGSPSKFKLPTIKLPKLGVALPQVNVEVPVMDTDIKVDGAGLKSPEVKVEAEIPEPATELDVKVKKSRFSFPKFSLTKQSSKESEIDIGLPDVDVSIPEGKMQITSPKVEFQPPEVDVNIDGPESKFKMPKFGISVPKMKGPDIDFSLSRKEGEIKLPDTEVELPDVDVKLPSVQVDIDAPKIEARPGSVEGSPSKFKLPTIKLPKLGVALPQVNVEVPVMDADIKVDGAGLKSPEVKVEAEIPEPATELDVKVKKSRFSFPKFSFTKQSSKESEVDIGLPDVDVSIPEGKMQIISPKVEFQQPQLDVNAHGDLKLPDSKITLPSAKDEIEVTKIEGPKSRVEGSPTKFKLPPFNLPTFGGSPSRVHVEVPDVDKDTESDTIKLEISEEKANLVLSTTSIDIEGQSVELTTQGDELQGSGIKVKPVPDVDAEIKLPDVEGKQLEGTVSVPQAPKVEGDVRLSKGTGNVDVSPVSPSKFKLPSFKMPRLAFSGHKPEGQSVSPDTEYKDSRPEMKAELSGDGKSPQATPESFGVVLENLDVEFELPKTEKGEGHPETPKEEIERKDKQTKQEATKSPERTGWFRFPTFGLSSPSEPVKMPIKNDEKDKKSPSGEREEDMSPTCSARSSDIYADISSTATSEYVSLHSSSPTKVTVKYSNQNLPPDLGEMNILTSTAMSELITIEPNLPEKITILSSEVLSSSEETLRLASEKIHVVTSKVQAGPESHRAKPLPTVQSTGEAGQMSSSWTVESSQSSRRTVSQKRIVHETSRESTETFVITKQITKTFEPSEFFANDETASSIQRLRESVHSEKMRFFDGAEK